MLHANVEVRRIDLRSNDGRAELSQLLDGSDVFLTAFRNASLERLSLDTASIRKQYPRLCHVAIVGHRDEMSEVAGHDLTYQARSGLLSNGAVPATLIADLVGVERAVSATYELLFARSRGSVDLTAEIALADGAHDFALPIRLGLTAANGPLGGANPFYGIYQTREGLLALAALEDKFWQRLLRLLAEQPELPQTLILDTQTVANWTSECAQPIREGLQRAFLQKSASEWEAWAQRNDLPMAAVLSPP